MTEEELAAIEARHNEACQGPWKSDYRLSDDGERLLGDDVPALIAEVRRLRAPIDRHIAVRCRKCGTEALAVFHIDRDL